MTKGKWIGLALLAGLGILAAITLASPFLLICLVPIFLLVIGTSIINKHNEKRDEKIAEQEQQKENLDKLFPRDITKSLEKNKAKESDEDLVVSLDKVRNNHENSKDINPDLLVHKDSKRNNPNINM